MAPPSRTTIAPASAAPIVTPARTANSGPPTSARARAGSQRQDDGPTGADDVRGIDPEMRMASEEWSRDLCPGSLDSRHFSTPRRCSFRGVVDVNPDLLAVRVAIDPTADGPGFGILRALDELILQPAPVGLTVVPVNRFPLLRAHHGTDPRGRPRDERCRDRGSAGPESGEGRTAPDRRGRAMEQVLTLGVRPREARRET